MSILQTTDLKKYYGAEPNITKALDGVTLSIEMAVTICLNRKRKGERNEIRRNCRNPYTVT